MSYTTPALSSQQIIEARAEEYSELVVFKDAAYVNEGEREVTVDPTCLPDTCDVYTWRLSPGTEYLVRAGYLCWSSGRDWKCATLYLQMREDFLYLCICCYRQPYGLPVLWVTVCRHGLQGVAV